MMTLADKHANGILPLDYQWLGAGRLGENNELDKH
jgi:hypothetical protein